CSHRRIGRLRSYQCFFNRVAAVRLFEPADCVEQSFAETRRLRNRAGYQCVVVNFTSCAATAGLTLPHAWSCVTLGTRGPETCCYEPATAPQRIGRSAQNEGSRRAYCIAQGPAHVLQCVLSPAGGVCRTQSLGCRGSAGPRGARQAGAHLDSGLCDGGGGVLD